MATLDYRLDVRHPATREIGLELTVSPAAFPTASPAPGEFELFLPTWTPGSYLVREYARHLSRVVARDAATGADVPVRKVAKNRVRLVGLAPGQRVVVAGSVYAHELSERTADLSHALAYWNHACLLLWPVGARSAAARLAIAHPPAWELACALPRVDDGSAPGAAVLHADDLAAAMDAPVLLGELQRLRWDVDGVAHELVADGLGPVALPPRLRDDLRAVVTQAQAVFGGPLPYASYVFQCLFAADGHGGLEHAASTTLLMARAALASDAGYREFVALAAHEHFHAWNVKRMRPAEFWDYDYERENHTEFLWLAEGWTAYYDDLLCLRAGVFTRQQYLEAATKNVQGMFAAPGRMRLSLRESSFDAWIRLYRPDENTRNSSQNYYGNGAVAAMCLDLSLRRATGNAASLDHVLRRLYAATFAAGRGYTPADVQRALADVGGEGAVAMLESLVADRLDPPLAELLGAFGLRLTLRDTERPYLGIHFEGASTIVASVQRATPAYDAGVHPGDELLAVDGMRVDGARWNDVWQAVAKVGRPVELLLARRGLVQRMAATPKAAPGTAAIEVDDGASPAAKAMLAGWLPDARGAANPADGAKA
ncbi:MAG: M61 family metallopeptidase [Planctomycetota bacterium]